MSFCLMNWCLLYALHGLAVTLLGRTWCENSIWDSSFEPIIIIFLGDNYRPSLIFLTAISMAIYDCLLSETMRIISFLEFAILS